jgi:transcriptional regulator with XRE-family HTH domain
MKVIFVLFVIVFSVVICKAGDDECVSKMRELGLNDSALAGQKISKLMAKSKVSLEQMAKVLKISEVSMKYLLNGKVKIDVSQVFAIVDFLGVDIEAVAGDPSESELSRTCKDLEIIFPITIGEGSQVGFQKDFLLPNLRKALAVVKRSRSTYMLATFEQLNVALAFARRFGHQMATWPEVESAIGRTYLKVVR